MGLSFYQVCTLPYPLQSIGETAFVIPPGATFKMPNRWVKILYFFGGNCRLQLSPETTFDITEGSIVIIPKTCIQLYHSLNPNAATRVHALVLLIDDRAVTEPEPMLNEHSESLIQFIKENFTDFMHFSTAADPAIWNIISEVRREVEHHLIGSSLKIESFLTCLLVELARKLQSSTTAEETPPPPSRSHLYIVNQTKEFIIKNYSLKLSLGQIAWHVQRSEENLARIFRKEVGKTVFDYIREIRLTKAKSLLLGTSQSITQISTQTGFSSSAHFCRVFRENIGVTPGQYRTQHDGSQHVHQVRHDLPEPLSSLPEPLKPSKTS